MSPNQTPTASSDFNDLDEKSERHKMADRVARFIREQGLNHGPETGEVEKCRHTKKNMRYYKTKFQYLSSLEGRVDIYGKSFMLVWFARNQPGSDLHGEHKLVFVNEQECQDFLLRAFVDVDEGAAKSVRCKKQKGEDGLTHVGEALENGQ